MSLDPEPIGNVAQAVTAITGEVSKLTDLKNQPSLQAQVESLALIEYYAGLGKALALASANPNDAAAEADVQRKEGV